MAHISNLLSQSLLLPFNPIATVVLHSSTPKPSTTAARKTMIVISTLINAQDAPSLAIAVLCAY
jgi:hypothetical protein